jgi:hypothetical protein
VRTGYARQCGTGFPATALGKKCAATSGPRHFLPLGQTLGEFLIIILRY